MEKGEKTQYEATIDRLMAEFDGFESEGKQSCTRASADAKEAKDLKTSTNDKCKNLVAAKGKERVLSKCLQKVQAGLGLVRNKECTETM